MCSRRAGKTHVCLFLLFLTALATPQTTNLYLGLTAASAGEIYTKVWKPLVDRFNLPETDHLDSKQQTTFANGSTVRFGGTDDIKHVKTLLGSSMASSIVIVDECQDQTSVLEILVTSVLDHMLEETNDDHKVSGRRLVLAGTSSRISSRLVV